LEISVPKSLTELKEFLKVLDQYLLKKAIECMRGYYKAILEDIDKSIAEYRSRDLEIEHRREVWYQTCLGSIKVKRRQYRDRQGRRGCLLDETIGMSKYNHTTVTVQKLALEMASYMPYRRSAEILQKTSAIDLAHQTIWRMVGKVADPYIKKEEQELEWFVKTGELPEGAGKKVSRLMVEADGVILSLQREQERKAEVKLGIAYEGWEKVGKDRYRTVNKTAFTTIAGKDQFWTGMSLKLQKAYELSSVEDTIVGGDGAGWIKEGASYVNGRYQLDRYHLHKELCAALGRDNETKGRVWEACEKGEISAGLAIMSEAMKQARGEQLLRIVRAYRYIQENSAGIGDYRLSLGEEGKTLRHTGAIEGNIDKLIVRRMKNQGMSWKITGIKRLLCVRFLILEKKLNDWIEKRNSPQLRSKINIPQRKIRRVVTRLSIQEPDEWIKVNLPALYGPHASRPWVKYLKSLSQVTSL
jgi:hypothetical protein